MHFDPEHNLVQIGRKLPEREPPPGSPDWKQANPKWIRKALRIATARPSGGWYVVEGSHRVTERPRCITIAGQPLVAWRAHGQPMVAPNSCPHMGAALHEARVEKGELICPWHGLALGASGHGRWRPFPTYDDGVLTWVRLDEAGVAPTERPFIAERPTLDTTMNAVMRLEARCHPSDVIQNRLDPWHGVHFHPHSFGSLHVLEQLEDEITVRVTYKVAGPFGVQVDARFHCPEPRTIVMTIVAGDGEGSVVETHATPISEDRTAVIEAVLATSNRPGFKVARRAGRLLRPFMEAAARKLWREDAAYAERLFEIRREEEAARARAFSNAQA